MAEDIQLKEPVIYFACTVASIGGLLFGFDMAVVSGVLPFVQKQFNLSAVQEGWFVSSALLGCITGVAFSGLSGDRLGRKKLLIVAALFFLVSATGCAFFSSYTLIVFSRIISGIGVGIASNIVPLYISEIAPAKIRGRLVTYYQLAVTLGILVAYCSNALILNLNLTQPWRLMFGIGIVPSFLLLTGLFFIPESPRWRLQNDSKENSSYQALLAPGIRKALVLGVLLPLFSQCCGINAIIYYGPSILSKAGISLSSSFQSQVIFGLANLLFTFIAVWKVDAVGRRPLYLVGTAIASLSLGLTGLCFYLGLTSTLLLPVLVLFFLASFAFSIGPLKFVVASEIFPAAIRGKAMAVSIMVMWVADTIVGLLTPISLRALGVANTFWVFTGFCLVALVTVYRLLPETKGKSLEEIAAGWKNN